MEAVCLILGNGGNLGLCWLFQVSPLIYIITFTLVSLSLFSFVLGHFSCNRNELKCTKIDSNTFIKHEHQLLGCVIV